MTKTKLKLRKDVILNLLKIIFLIIIIISMINIFNWNKDNIKIKDMEEEIKKITEITEIKEEGEIINPPVEKESDYWYYIKVPFQNVEFKSLLEKNSDTVGFINVKNTNINYPIVQTNNNNYYLKHAYDKSYNDAGWVYMDYRNSNNFDNFNTIIYGHGRLNNTVFGSLKDLLTEKWQNNKDNYTMAISTPNTNFIYQIFSIYTIDVESYYINTEFSTDEDKNTWINEMNKRNTSIIYAPANSNDKIITLSTCVANNDNKRIVVHAKLIKQMQKETNE